MAETFKSAGKLITLIDLSDRLENETSHFEPMPHRIEYVDHRQSVARTTELFGLGPGDWPDGMAWAAETVTLSTHSGTHVDAPYHYGPTLAGRPARTIDDVPLRWCYGDGVLLDMTGKRAGEGISDDEVRAALEVIGYRLRPYDVVLIRTDASRSFKEPGYELRQPGLRRSATEWLVDQGIRLVGIDAWTLDRPFDVMAAEARSGDRDQLWETHFLGKEKEYCQIERLCNLDEIPVPFGFRVVAFPVSIARASAGWSRVVAIVEQEL